MTNHPKTTLALLLIEILTAAGSAVFFVTLLANPQPAKAQLSLGWGVGGRLAPAALPPAGDGDVLNFGFSCGALVTIVGPEGGDWGVYQWAVGVPYDYYAQSYLTNGYPYTHADEYMLGYAIPSVNPGCPLPMLISIGTSLFKATLP